MLLKNLIALLNYLTKPSRNFNSKLLNISGMDDLFLNRMLFEWLRNR